MVGKEWEIIQRWIRLSRENEVIIIKRIRIIESNRKIERVGKIRKRKEKIRIIRINGYLFKTKKLRNQTILQILVG